MRKYIQRALSHSPRLKLFARWFARRVDTVIMKLIQFVRGSSFEPVYINPQDVLYTVSRYDKTLKGNNKWHFGSKKAGDWDRNGYTIDEYGLIMPILKKRIDSGKPFEEIAEYRQNLEYIKVGGTPDNCNTCSKYKAKWQKIEILYHQIKKYGYKTQSELGTDDIYNELRIQIGRNGEPLFEDGIHRLVISKLLRMQSIPAIITRQHIKYARRDSSSC